MAVQLRRNTQLSPLHGDLNEIGETCDKNRVGRLMQGVNGMVAPPQNGI